MLGTTFPDKTEKVGIAYVRTAAMRPSTTSDTFNSLNKYPTPADPTKLGAKNESYSKIIRRLIDAYKIKK
jgi:hypothetical protein